MGDNLISSVVTVLTAIIGLAIISVLVSKNATTTSILSSGGSAFSGALRAAEAPVSGTSTVSGSLQGFAGADYTDGFA